MANDDVEGIAATWDEQRTNIYGKEYKKVWKEKETCELKGFAEQNLTNKVQAEKIFKEISESGDHYGGMLCLVIQILLEQKRSILQGRRRSGKNKLRDHHVVIAETLGSNYVNDEYIAGLETILERGRANTGYQALNLFDNFIINKKPRIRWELANKINKEPVNSTESDRYNYASHLIKDTRYFVEKSGVPLISQVFSPDDKLVSLLPRDLIMQQIQNSVLPQKGSYDYGELLRESRLEGDKKTNEKATNARETLGEIEYAERNEFKVFKLSQLLKHIETAGRKNEGMSKVIIGSFCRSGSFKYNINNLIKHCNETLELPLLSEDYFSGNIYYEGMNPEMRRELSLSSKTKPQDFWGIYDKIERNLSDFNEDIQQRFQLLKKKIEVESESKKYVYNDDDDDLDDIDDYKVFNGINLSLNDVCLIFRMDLFLIKLGHY